MGKSLAFHSYVREALQGRPVVSDVHLAEPEVGRVPTIACLVPVRGPDNAFIVDMPGDPVYKLIDTVSPGCTKFVYHSYSLDYRRLAFVAQTALYPADVDVRQPKLNLQAVLDDRAQRLAGGKWTRIDWREVSGAPAAESIGSIAGGSVLRQLVLLKGRRYVSLACLGPAEALRTPEVERFFRSLRLGA